METLEKLLRDGEPLLVRYSEYVLGLHFTIDGETKYSFKGDSIKDALEGFGNENSIKTPTFGDIEVNNYISTILKEGKKSINKISETELLFGYSWENKEYFLKLKIQDEDLRDKKILSKILKRTKLIREGSSKENFYGAYEDFSNS